LGNWTSYGIIAPLVSGVTSIIDEAEFDAMRWYSILKSKSNYLVYCAHGNQALNAYGGHKAKRRYNLENLRSILSVGEPLNAEAVIWGEVLILLWTIGGKRKRRYYDSQLSFNESKTRFHGKTFACRNCHWVNGKQLKIITEPNVQGQLVLKKASFPISCLSA
jgi:acetyl-CoA synthetase